MAKINLTEIPSAYKNIKVKGFYVYMGLNKKSLELVYIGTTIQIPNDRFRWHKYNGKDLVFFVIASLESQEEMLDMEFKMIQMLKPKMNKIAHRRQNFNAKLSQSELDSRVGDTHWCQCCLKRHVTNPRFTMCKFCEEGIGRAKKKSLLLSDANDDIPF